MKSHRDIAHCLLSLFFKGGHCDKLAYCRVTNQVPQPILQNRIELGEAEAHVRAYLARVLANQPKYTPIYSIFCHPTQTIQLK